MLRSGPAVLAGDEPFLHGLAADSEPGADLGPRGAVAAGLVDEIADEVLAEFAEVAGQADRDRQPVQGRRAITRLRRAGR
jgi:hypothetical protein